MVGYGILEPLMEDPSITEIMVNGPHRVFVERGGRLESVDISFRDESQLSDLISRMVAPLGRRIDASCPYVDGRLPDGSRINAIIPPLSLCGPVLTIRKFSSRALSLSDLVGLGSLNEEMADFLALAIRGRLNVLISGGAGSGKTTTLNALVSSLPASERILTIEDAAELHLDLSHVVSLECRPANAEGRGEVTIRQLLRNALRMRPDRIVVGECRGEEAVDMLQAMNTGHPGSACTVHANSAFDALTRLENMVSMGDATLPLSAIRAQVRSALDVVIHQVRFPDGSRKIAEVALVRDDDPPLRLLFRYCGGSDGGFRRLAGVPLTPLQQEKLQREGLTVPAWLREKEGPV
ncbi:MAG TPA: CpaF family protein [Firmicutes bacterium]|nr:CpaF family protein [Bacillota bacterium]